MTHHEDIDGTVLERRRTLLTLLRRVLGHLFLKIALLFRATELRLQLQDFSLACASSSTCYSLLFGLAVFTHLHRMCVEAAMRSATSGHRVATFDYLPKPLRP